MYIEFCNHNKLNNKGKAMARTLVQAEKQSLSDIAMAYERHRVGIKNSVQNVILEFHGQEHHDCLETILIRRGDIPVDIWRGFRGMRHTDAVKIEDDNTILVGYPVLEALINLLLGILQSLLNEDREYFDRSSKVIPYYSGSHDLIPWEPEP